MTHSICTYNPASRSAPSVAMIEKVRSRLAAKGYAVEFQATERPQHATDLARNAADSSADLVIACGGVGTIQEVASGLAHSKTPLFCHPVQLMFLLAS